MLRPIGIDVGPAKGGHIADGTRVINLGPCLLERYLADLGTDVLIAWDAPLTACTDPDGPLIESDLTLRVIDGFLRKLDLPDGISVQPYMSCPHWTITRRMLGLPRLGKYDDPESIPFSLVTSDGPRPASGRHVVEVHPAVALWFWFRGDLRDEGWVYKKDQRARDRLWALVKERFSDALVNCCAIDDCTAICDDDLDAVVAWLLARRWLDGQGVALVGDCRTGAMLLPTGDAALDQFGHYAGIELKRRALSRKGRGSHRA